MGDCKFNVQHNYNQNYTKIYIYTFFSAVSPVAYVSLVISITLRI